MKKGREPGGRKCDSRRNAICGACAKEIRNACDGRVPVRARALEAGREAAAGAQGCLKVKGYGWKAAQWG